MKPRNAFLACLSLALGAAFLASTLAAPVEIPRTASYDGGASLPTSNLAKDAQHASSVPEELMIADEDVLLSRAVVADFVGKREQRQSTETLVESVLCPRIPLALCEIC